MSEITQTGGYLDVVDATLRAPRLEATSNIGIANTNPEHAFSVGSNLYVDTESSNVITVRGNVVTQGVKVGTIEIVPSYDLAAVSNVGNVTANTIIFTNETQGFVATGNATIGSTLTISGFRITAAAAAEDDLEAITTSTQDKPNAGDTTNAIRVRNGTESTSFDTGALQVGTNAGANGGLGVAGNVHVAQGVYTQDLSVSGDVVSNLAVNTDDLFVDIVNSRVGIGVTTPTAALDVVGNVAVDTNTLFVDSVNNKVGIGVTLPAYDFDVQNSSDAADKTMARLYSDSNASGVSNTGLRLEKGVGYGGILKGFISQAVGSGLSLHTLNGGIEAQAMTIMNSGKVGVGTTELTGQLEVHGEGQTSFASFDPTGNMGGTIALRDDGGASGNGGAIMIGTNNGFHGAIKGLLIDGSNYTGGDLGFYTRGTTTDLVMTNRMTIRQNGNVGIGRTNPGYTLHVNGRTQVDGASALMMEVKRGNAGPVARIGSTDGILEIASIASTYGNETVTMQSYIDQGDSGTFSANDRNILALQPYVGRVGIGITDPPETLTVQHNTITPSFGLRRKTYNDYVVYMKTTTGSYQTVNTGDDATLLVGKGSGSNRSINAEGTINASGSDYAEYMKKSRTDLVINKGDIVGINNNGELTNVFSESIQFVVKSTNPSYVGGSSWSQGTVNSPEYPPILLTVDEYSNIPSQDATLYSYWEEQNMYANTEQLNTFYEENEKYLEDKNIHREPYDRIAFCGQVPVNVYNSVPGQYIIPTQTDDDTISYELTNTPTFEQYRVSIGKVVKIEEDGRAFIVVKIS